MPPGSLKKSNCASIEKEVLGITVWPITFATTTCRRSVWLDFKDNQEVVGLGYTLKSSSTCGSSHVAVDRRSL